MAECVYGLSRWYPPPSWGYGFISPPYGFQKKNVPVEISRQMVPARRAGNLPGKPPGKMLWLASEACEQCPVSTKYNARWIWRTRPRNIETGYGFWYGSNNTRRPLDTTAPETCKRGMDLGMDLPKIQTRYVFFNFEDSHLVLFVVVKICIDEENNLNQNWTTEIW